MAALAGSVPVSAVTAAEEQSQPPCRVCVDDPSQALVNFMDRDVAGVVRMLLASGADVNVRGPNGMTPLLWAVRNGYAEAACVLLEAGADVNARDEGGRTALMLSAGTPGIWPTLLTYEPDLDAIDDQGFTALAWAAMADDGHLVRDLLELGAKVDATALYWAAGAWPRRHTCTLLLEHGADVNAAWVDGNTALMHAAREGNREIMRLLLDQGADVNAQNIRGETALMFARQSGWPDEEELAQLLVEAGARE